MATLLAGHRTTLCQTCQIVTSALVMCVCVCLQIVDHCLVMVCLRVCVLDMTMTVQKMAEPIKKPCIKWGPDPTMGRWEGEILGVTWPLRSIAVVLRCGLKLPLLQQLVGCELSAWKDTHTCLWIDWLCVVMRLNTHCSLAVVYRLTPLLACRAVCRHNHQTCSLFYPLALLAMLQQ